MNVGLEARKVKARDCHGCGGLRTPNARSSGQLEPADASDDTAKVPDESDQTSRVAPSDRRQYLTKPKIEAPGAHGWNGYGPDSQNGQAPGSGSGPRTKRSTGASRSEMSRLSDTVPEVKARGAVIKSVKVDAKGKVIKKIFTKAPPGREDQVLELKKKFGEDSSTPFKIAWSQENKGK